MRSIISTLAATLSLAALFSTQLTFAQVTASPSVINFQGRIATPSGNPVPDGTYSIRFSLHDALSAGTEKWNQTLPSVIVKNGTFAVPLSGFSSTTFDGNLWLEIQIGTDAPLAPRTPLVSVPYAIKSNLALTVPDGSITNDKLAGNITADKLANGTLNSLAWLLGGNSAVSSGFLGTTDNNPLIFRTNNAERLRILANGNVGIGTITPTAQMQIGNGLDFSNITTFGVIQRPSDTVALSLRQAANPPRNTVLQFITGSVGNYIEHERSTNNLLIGSNGSGGNPTLTVASNGNVGIGITSPGVKLDIGDNSFPSIRANSTSTAGTWLRLINSTTGGHNWNLISSGSGNGEGAGKLLFNDQTSGGTRMAIDNSGKVGIGTATPTDNLTVVGSGTAISAIDGDVRTRLFSASGTGTGYVGTSSNSWFVIRTNDSDRLTITNNGLTGIGAIPYNNSRLRLAPNGLTFGLSVDGDSIGNFWYLLSDARYKQNIETVPDAISTLLALRGVTYEHNLNAPNAITGHPGRNYGFIAQEVEKVLPTLVKEGTNGYKAVNYMGIIPVTVEAIKTLNARTVLQQKQIDAKDVRIAELEAKLDAVLKRLDTLEEQTGANRK